MNGYKLGKVCILNTQSKAFNLRLEQSIKQVSNHITYFMFGQSYYIDIRLFRPLFVIVCDLPVPIFPNTASLAPANKLTYY